MGEETKAPRGTAHTVEEEEEEEEEEEKRTATTRRRGRKKKEPRWRHTSSVFSGHPPVLLANSFFRRRPSPSRPPVPDPDPPYPARGPTDAVRFSYSCSGYPRAICTLARPITFSFCTSLLLLHPSSSLRTPGPSISSPTVPRYPEESKRNGGTRIGIEKEKNVGARRRPNEM